MSVKLAKKTGFCFGVKRAVRMAAEALEKKKRPIYSLGSIIHNEQLCRDLSRKGLKVIEGINEIKKGVLVISSHGLSPEIRASIVKRGIDIIDTTCPFVLNAQRIARRLSAEGYLVVIAGDASHPEVRALVGFAGRNARVVRDRAEAAALRINKGDRVSIISQTTQSKANFRDVVKVISQKKPEELKVFNTICADAGSRQAHAKRLARQVDLMIVVGGKASANTRRLLDVCAESGSARHIETASEIRGGWFKAGRSVGITSGASTPDWIVEEVVNKIKNITTSKNKKSKERGCSINVRRKK